MSRQRRRDGSPLSLFAFQDIITSVTAIMILLVLIMTLELLTKTMRAGVAVDDLRNAVELKQSVAIMAKRVDALRVETRDAKQTARTVAKRTAEDLNAENRNVQRKSEELTRELAALQARQSQSQRKRTEAENKLRQIDKASSGALLMRQRAEGDRVAAEQLVTRNEQEEKRQKAIRAELATTPKKTATLVFNPPQGASLKPLLVELSSSGIAVFASDESEPRAFGWGLLGPSGSFLDWLKKRDKGREYIVVMLRPSGLDKLDSVRNAIAKQGMQLGLELVGDEVDIALARDQRDGD